MSSTERKKIFISSYICNVLEGYDFIITGILIPYISHYYFPLINPFFVLLAGSLTFMVGFFMRPVGAIFFGHIGDIYGRKKALLASVFGMALSTGLIGILPTYETLFFMAPIFLVLLRCAQGFCLGGEGQGGNVFVLEHYKGQNPGRTGGFLAISNGMAALLGFSIGMIVTSPHAPEWAWRICYLVGASVGLVGLYLRSHIPDTPVFKRIKRETKSIPFFSLFKEQKLNVLSVILCVGVGSSLTYTGFTFVNLFLNKFLDFTPRASLAFSLFGTVIGMICVGAGGTLSDKIGEKILLKFTLIFLMISIIPVHYLLSRGNYLSISRFEDTILVLSASEEGQKTWIERHVLRRLQEALHQKGGGEKIF